jgi:hypothetical protein
MKIRIVFDSSKSIVASRIEDADTGQVIPGVRAIKFKHTVGSFPRVTLEFIKETEVEIVAEGELEDVTEIGDEFTRKRLVPSRPA